ncbi:hypothetical protein [Halomonas maura]|uniref:hypothetical protein n=1 Tax=Halomonas maura TaxID=117606 RepID=UPI0025B5C62C|nr:hypothetical protein [Halomonas maura]MDN3555806.1 hypothetical protein [Halomonas maura]
MTQTIPMASGAARQRANWLVMAGVLVLAAGGLIACWGKVGLPLGLIGLAAAATALLRPERHEPGDPEAASRTMSLQHLSQASLLTLAALQLAA